MASPPDGSSGGYRPEPIEVAVISDAVVRNCPERSRLTFRTHFLPTCEPTACVGTDPELFFPVSETGLSQTQIWEAKQVCHACPVQWTCLAWAVLHGMDVVREGKIAAWRDYFDMNQFTSQHVRAFQL